MSSRTIEAHIEVLDPLGQQDQNPTLFRYMKLSTLFLLLERKAFFPSIESLRRDDPFEGELFCDPVYLAGKLQDSNTRKWLRKKANNWELECLNSKATCPNSNSQLLSDIYVRELRERRAAWCWFQNDLESAGMWSVYGNRGVALRTSLKSLISSLPQNRLFQLGQIRYVDRRSSSENAFHPRTNDCRLITRPHLLKAIEYEHENEVRVITECPAKCGGVLVDDIDWQSLVEEIIISPLLPTQEAAAIKALLKNYQWKEEVNIKRSDLLPDNRMDSYDGWQEAVRSDRGGCYELGLPDQMSKL